MRRLLIVLLLTPLFTIAQQCSEVVEIPNKTADQLYSAAKEWFAIAFNSANDVIQLADPVGKKIIGKGIKKVDFRVKGASSYFNVNFTLIVQFKDGRYKYDIQSSEINSIAGETFTFELLKELGTEDGLKEYYKKKAVPAWMVSKKQFLANVESNKYVVAEIERQLHATIDDLTIALKKEDATNNW